MRYLLLLLYTAPVWGGSITLLAPVTSSCIVTTLPTNAIVANDCNSTPGISATEESNLIILADWGEDLFAVTYNAEDGIVVSNVAADPSLVATESLSGHLEYNQNFIITGGSGVGFISSSLQNEVQNEPFPGSISCGLSISTGETNPTGPIRTVPFTFGVPFSVQIFVDINTQLSVPHLFSPSEGAVCQNDTGIFLYNSQSQQLTSFDAEPTNLPVPEMPEPRTWLLVSAGLFGCWLTRSRAS